MGSGEISSFRRQRSNEQDLHESKAVSLPTVRQDSEINKLLKETQNINITFVDDLIPRNNAT